MVTTAKRLDFFHDREVTALALSAGAAFFVILVAIVTRAGIGTTILALLHVAALTGAAVAWLRAQAAARAAEELSAELASLARRLGRLEQHVRAAEAAAPATPSTEPAAAGTVGLLSSAVRELARNAAAQNRDVANLKDTPSGAARPDEAERPALRIGPDQRSAENHSRPGDPQPEPSLLPARSQAREDEIGRMRLVVQAFEADRIELHLQPVVALPQRKVRFYEVLSRLRLTDGTLLGPAEFLPVLERLGRAPELDRRVLARGIAVARHLLARGSEAIVGVNLSARSVAEPGFLHSLARITEAAPEVMGKVVLEFSQAAWRCLDAEQREALAILRGQGVPLSLDRAADLSFDARALADLGVRFMKLPADLLIATAEQEETYGLGQETSVRDFASVLRREGIKLVAERVESEEMVPALVDLGMPLAQGFVFAAPRAVRADVLGQASPGTAFSAAVREPALRRAG